MKILGYIQFYIRIDLEDDVAYTKVSFRAEGKMSRGKIRKLLKNVKRAYVVLGRTVNKVSLCSRAEYEENVGECICDITWEGEEQC